MRTANRSRFRGRGRNWVSTLKETPEAPSASSQCCTVVERIDADSLVLMMMNHSWLRRCVKDNPDAIEHTVIDGRVILTAQPEILQEFVAKHRQTKGALSGPVVLTRR